MVMRIASAAFVDDTSLPARTHEPQSHLRLLEQCYRYAYLKGRRDLGARLSEADHLSYHTLSRQLQGDPEGRRRGHRRFQTKIEAVVKTEEGVCFGLVLNLSGAGMYVAIMQQDATHGDTVQVKLGEPGQVEYLFTCEVVRQVLCDGVAYLGLRFNCVPLEMRLGPDSGR
jgi:hypothetical protein